MPWIRYVDQAEHPPENHFLLDTFSDELESIADRAHSLRGETLSVTWLPATDAFWEEILSNLSACHGVKR